MENKEETVEHITKGLWGYSLEELRKLASENTTKEISEITGVSQKSVRDSLYRRGITARKSTKRKWGKTREEFIKLGQKHTIYELAEIFDKPVPTVRSVYERSDIDYVRKKAGKKPDNLGKTPEELANLGEENTLREIAIILGRSNEHVRQVYKRLGIEYKADIDKKKKNPWDLF